MFIVHNTGILDKVTLQSHIRCPHFQNAFPLSVLQFKRWMATLGALTWFASVYEYFERVCGVGDAFITPCSNSSFDVWLYESDPLKHTVLHCFALENVALLLHSYLLFHLRAFPFLFQGIGPEIP